MNISEEQLQLIREFGEKEYSCQKIIKLLEIEEAEDFKNEFRNPESVVNVMYNSLRPKKSSRLEEAEARNAELQGDLLKSKLDNITKRLELRTKLFGV